MNPPQILYCHCQYARVLPEAVKQAVLEQLCSSGLPFTVVPDLCELAARRDPWLVRLAAAGSLKIAACFPRAVQGLFAAAGAPLARDHTEVVNLRSLPAEAATAALLAAELSPNLPAGKDAPPQDGAASSGSRGFCPIPLPVNTPLPHLVLYEGVATQPLPAGERLATLTALLEQGFTVTCTAPDQPHSPPNGRHFPGRAPLPVAPAESPEPTPLDWQTLRSPEPAARAAELTAAGRPPASAGAKTWLPWFPVVDYDRCTHCMQCLSFCLFGVYGVDADKHLRVEHPEQCKTNCPACARVCPEAAIMFPKYKAGPINGETVNDAALQREQMKIDISALLGGDVYALLRTRSERARSRFSKERDANKALAERQKCLAQLAADVPPEVLQSLPSPEEIARRAEAAVARARAARPG